MSNSALFIAFWSVSRWGRDYGYRSIIYMGGYHRGQDIQGGAWGARDVPVLVAGRVVAAYRTSKLGWVVVIDTGRTSGRYHAYCHMAEKGAARVGTYLATGATVGHLASEFENPGIIGVTWLGRHLHLVVSNHIDGAHVQRPTYDPRPIIRDALAAASGNGTPAGGGNAKPFTPPTSKGAPDMREYYRNQKTGEIVVITGREAVSLGFEDARKMLDIDRINHQRNPQVYPDAPDIDNADSFFSLDDHGWSLMLALYPYRGRS